MSKPFFRSPTSFSFIDYNTFLSLGLVPFPVSRLSRQVSHYSSIFSMLGSPRQSSIHLTTSSSGLFKPLFMDCPDTCLALLCFLSCKGKFVNPFLLSLTLKPEPRGQISNFCFLLLEHSPLAYLHH